MTNSNIALARRFWMHVHEGGALTSHDVGRMVTALEETFQMYVDANEARIDAEEKLRKSALQELSALGQASEAYQAQLAAEAKLEKVATRLQHIAANKISDELSVVEWDTHDTFSILDGCILSARATLAELKGQGDG